MGVRGRSPRNFTTNFLKFVKFLLNHHRNIVIVIISQKFGGGGQYRLVGGGQLPPCPYGIYGPDYVIVTVVDSKLTNNLSKSSINHFSMHVTVMGKLDDGKFIY